MAVVSIRVHHPSLKGITQIRTGPTDSHLSLQKVYRCFSPSIVGDSSRRWNVLHNGPELSKVNRKQRVVAVWIVYNRSLQVQRSKGMPLVKGSHEKCTPRSAYQGEKHCCESYASETGNSGKQLRALDSYFHKLHVDIDEQPSYCVTTNGFGKGSDAKDYEKQSFSQLEGQMTQMVDTRNQCKTETGLDSLESYFVKLNTGMDTRRCKSPTLEEASERYPIRMPNSATREYLEKERKMGETNSYKHLKRMDSDSGRLLFADENIQGLQTYDGASYFCLINFLIAINVAVYLFEIASPIRNSEIEHLSLPLIYGAKINSLILIGEWWRLLTPMFLHSGFPHVALGCWVLLSFGPQICRGYGPFTFFLIYVLGGICRNLTSFIHTPELTVCGTGPAFAIIGASIVYQIQNKQLISKEVSESMFWKAVIATALSFLLSQFGRIDDWTHLGAAFSGVIYGYLTCPTLQLLDNTSPPSKKQGIALVERHKANPFKSLLAFAISIISIFTCLVFFYGPQLEMLELEGFV